VRALGPRVLALLAGAALLTALAACSIPSTGSAATPTPAGPTPTPTPTVIYQNTLTTASSDWQSDQNCFFGSDGYHIKGSFLCFAPAGTLGDLDMSVQVKQISGPTTNAYGIALRRPSSGNRYEFDIDSNSKWLFVKCVNDNCTNLSDFTATSAISGGLTAANTLRVRAVGSHFDFFVNGTQVGQTDDTTFTSGDVGLGGTDGSEVVFSNLKIIKPA
jgi:hypothetical protein